VRLLVIPVKRSDLSNDKYRVRTSSEETGEVRIAIVYIALLTSELGQLQTFDEPDRMSALPRKRTSESRTVMSALGQQATFLRNESGEIRAPDACDDMSALAISACSPLS
jgi:hypothetical protein